MKNLFYKKAAGFTPHHFYSLKAKSNTRLSKSGAGFTLIELLVVVTIIATLAVAVFVALNPAQRIRDAKDARRTSDVSSILTAIHSCIVDGRGSCAPFTGAALPISQIGTGVACDGLVPSSDYAADCTVGIGQAACLNVATSPLANYLRANPIDPDGTTTETLYTVEVSAVGIVTVKACGTERTPAQGGLIQSSR